MEARAFGAPGPRTWARESRFGRGDTLLLLAGFAISATALAVSIAVGAFNPILGPS